MYFIKDSKLTVKNQGAGVSFKSDYTHPFLSSFFTCLYESLVFKINI